MDQFNLKQLQNLIDRIFEVNENNFVSVALDVFNFQYKTNPVYKKYCDLLNCVPQTIESIHDIPFLPISFFKTVSLKCGDFKAESIFESSGTSNQTTSKHYIKHLKLYEKSFISAFKHFYGDIEDYCILALLPSYLERTNSSLVYMVNNLIERSKDINSGFYLHNHNDLALILNSLAQKRKKTLLIGVSFGLLDFIECQNIEQHNQLIVMETGGMKGRRQELIREELHERLKEGFKVSKIHSEYGMTELLSQAYSTGDGKFNCPSWMKVLIREYDDPLSYASQSKSGGLNIIDLANLFSCSFIQTDDLGKRNQDGSFAVLGRFDRADVRGCNLLIN